MPFWQKELALHPHDPLGLIPRHRVIDLLLNQFRSPLVLILIGASLIAMLLESWVDASVVLLIVAGSTILGFSQEFIANNALKNLQSLVRIQAMVLREGQTITVEINDLKIGDIVLLSPGCIIPADGQLIEANTLYVNEAVLTGETFPVSKIVPDSTESDTVTQKQQMVFMGTSVQSGSGSMAVQRVGVSTQFGTIAERLNLRQPMTEFERGIHQFGHLLTQVMLVLLFVVLGVSIFLGRPAIDSFMFAIALAVGLTPELLPAIISITLSHGAKRMAKNGVIVRKLNAIENLGSMDVLCVDKTGTLTVGGITLHSAIDDTGQVSPQVLSYAALNATLQSGLNNPLDLAIKSTAAADAIELSGWKKINEIPLDFTRKRVSVVVSNLVGERQLITKGAFESILECCSAINVGSEPLSGEKKDHLRQLHQEWAEKGFRVLGIAFKPLTTRDTYSATDEKDLVFLGMLIFEDPPKPDTKETIQQLLYRGVKLKVITGDDRRVAEQIARAVGLDGHQVITGSELMATGDDALINISSQYSVFAEVNPNQKERIVRSLKRAGNVVGFMGDGINDVLAMHSADVSLSVSNAVDVAREAADFVLLKKELHIILAGIDEGRKTFANTMKYVLTTISANFGNMVSMGAASFILPYLPLLPSQILLNNLLSDIPAMALASDRVDHDRIARPRRWQTVLIRNYMIIFGLISSLFDLIAFAALLWLFHVSMEEFRTAWFVESLLTELCVALVVRTAHPCFKSRPGGLLLLSTGVVAITALVLPYIPFMATLGFVPLPSSILIGIIGLTFAYVVTVELAKIKVFGGSFPT